MANKPKTRKEVVLREGKPATIEEVELSHEEYYEVDDPKENESKKTKKKATKAIVISILVAVFALSFLIIQSTSLREEIEFWFKTKIIGISVGDGYPVSIYGSSVQNANFIAYDGNCIALSDTAFYMYSQMGKELKSVRHSLANPVLRYNGDNFVLYSVSDNSFITFSENTDEEKHTTTGDIIAADISDNGRYIVATLSTDYASEFNVYLSDDTLKYSYKFANSYITDIKLNSTGTQAAVSVIYSDNGTIYSDIFIFDFNQTEPLEKYTSVDNMVTELTYNSDSQIYAIGDNKIVGISDDKLKEYDYDGKIVTAISTENSRTIVSISGSESNGSCTVWIFDGTSDLVEFTVQDYVTQISSYGASLCLLNSSSVISYDLRGVLIGECEINYDTKAIAMANETDIYLLGLRQIDFVSLEPSING